MNVDIDFTVCCYDVCYCTADGQSFVTVHCFSIQLFGSDQMTFWKFQFESDECTNLINNVLYRE